MLEPRKEEERDFHSRRELDRRSMNPEAFEEKYPNKRFYSVTRKSTQVLHDWLRTNCPGKVALDYGCGLGKQTIEMARSGATAYGVDISEVEVLTATSAADKDGLSDRTQFYVMDAESMTFEDNFFDLVICSGVLHHLDINKAYAELYRVLKREGKILCIEALRHNPLISWYRRRTPHLRTAWEVNHILGIEDIRLAERWFGTVKVDFFHLGSILAVPFRNTPVFDPLLLALEALDSVVLKVPYLQLWAWQAIFELSDPRK